MPDFLVVYTEGETEKEFYSRLLRHLNDTCNHKISFKVKNLSGIGRFESKVASKTKNEVLNKHKPEEVHVVCAYDTDVFEQAKKPPTNFSLVKEKLDYIRSLIT